MNFEKTFGGLFVKCKLSKYKGCIAQANYAETNNFKPIARINISHFVGNLPCILVLGACTPR